MNATLLRRLDAIEEHFIAQRAEEMERAVCVWLDDVSDQDVDLLFHVSRRIHEDGEDAAAVLTSLDPVDRARIEALYNDLSRVTA